MDHQNGSKPRELLITKERWQELNSRPAENPETIQEEEKAEEAVLEEEKAQNTEE